MALLTTKCPRCRKHVQIDMGPCYPTERQVLYACPNCRDDYDGYDEQGNGEWADDCAASFQEED